MAAQATAQQEAVANGDSAKNPNVDLGWGAWLWKDASGFFTSCLVVIGGLQAFLFLYQLKLIRDSLDEARAASTIAKSAAIAANLNAQAVVDAERARLFVVINVENVIQMIQMVAQVPEPDDGTEYGLRLSYSLKNYGRTPALIQEVSHGAIFAPDLPVLREYDAVLDLPTQILGEKEISQPLNVDMPRLTGSIARAIDNCENRFWFYGCVVYDDSFGWSRTLNFIFNYDTVSRQFSWYDHSETERRRESGVGLSKPT
jgi:hypothetical protein